MSRRHLSPRLLSPVVRRICSGFAICRPLGFQTESLSCLSLLRSAMCYCYCTFQSQLDGPQTHFITPLSVVRSGPMKVCSLSQSSGSQDTRYFPLIDYSSVRALSPTQPLSLRSALNPRLGSRPAPPGGSECCGRGPGLSN